MLTGSVFFFTGILPYTNVESWLLPVSATLYLVKSDCSAETIAQIGRTNNSVPGIALPSGLAMLIAEKFRRAS